MWVYVIAILTIVIALVYGGRFQEAFYPLIDPNWCKLKPSPNLMPDINAPYYAQSYYPPASYKLSKGVKDPINRA